LSTVNAFTYTPGPANFNLRLIKQNKRLRHYLVDFPVVSPSYLFGGKTACGEYFEPIKKDNVPLTILIHGWGDHSVIPFKLMVAGLIRKGLACFILYLPFHSNRLSEEMKPRLSRLTPDEWFTGYQVSVTDVSRIVDWASQNSHIDSHQISIIALSLGAIVSSIAMGVDTRIKSGVFITHGGNTGKIMQISSISRFSGKYRLPVQEYQENQIKYAAYLAEVRQKGFDNVIPLQRTYLIDPLTYAPMLKGRPLLMINALWDEVFPQASSTDFWKACGECERIVLPATHASIWMWYPIIVHRINKFLELVVHH
jgi:hypothetical protein